MKCTPMIVVSDVAATSRWYQRLLGLSSGHGGDEFEMLMAGHEMVLFLHHLDFTEHASMRDPRDGVPGAGVLLYFSVDDVHSVYARAREMDAELIDEPHENPKAHAIEFGLRDPDGYSLSISQHTGH